MSEKDHEHDPKKSEKVAENDYEDSQFEKGIKETREQVSGDYTDGTIDRKKSKKD